MEGINLKLNGMEYYIASWSCMIIATSFFLHKETVLGWIFMVFGILCVLFSALNRNKLVKVENER